MCSRILQNNFLGYHPSLNNGLRHQYKIVNVNNKNCTKINRKHFSNNSKNNSQNSNNNNDKGNSLWDHYCELLEKYPLLTKGITSGIISGAGDSVCQISTLKKDEKFDFVRLSKFTFLGTVLVAPVLHVWYGSLNRMVSVYTL